MGSWHHGHPPTCTCARGLCPPLPAPVRDPSLFPAKTNVVLIPFLSSYSRPSLQPRSTLLCYIRTLSSLDLPNNTEECGSLSYQLLTPLPFQLDFSAPYL